MTKGIIADRRSCNGIRIEQVTLTKAISIFKSYKLDVPIMATCRIENGQFSAIIADYSSFPDYIVRYAIGIYKMKDGYDGDMIYRFNVMK